MPDDPRVEWDRVLAASVRLQQLVPDAVLVGGTAAALHLGHRVSLDDDHVIRDLVERFDEVLDALESTDGWVTARTGVRSSSSAAWRGWRRESGR